ncbi:ataxin-1-like [Drosophila gunungcola]|uniref:ataxin-1-like n=1 Tax=Drosophila gunungcola TaxID=103775 RepID=UPI0022E362AA|nr:ataxin-1-like [Drosophila gunungcola]
MQMHMKFSHGYGYEPIRRPPPPPPNPSQQQLSSNDSDACFRRGSYIELASGAMRRVEDIRTEDFIQSALRSQLFELREATVVRINRAVSPSHVTITFSYDTQHAKLDLEVLPGHPMFVYGQGWASCDPRLSLQLYELKCQQLQVGDICLSLVPREHPVAPPPPPPPQPCHRPPPPPVEFPAPMASPPAGACAPPAFKHPYQVYAQMASFVAVYTQHMIEKLNHQAN